MQLGCEDLPKIENLFQALLLDELDELEDLAAAAERRRRRRRAEHPDDSVAVPHALLQLRDVGRCPTEGAIAELNCVSETVGFDIAGS